MWLYGPFSGPGDGDGEVVYCPVCDKDNEHLVEVWPSEAREPALPLCCTVHLRDIDLTLDPAANGQDGPLIEARCFVTHPYPEDMGKGDDQEVNSARSVARASSCTTLWRATSSSLRIPARGPMRAGA